MPRAIRFKNDPNYQPPERKRYICHCEKVGEDGIADAVLNKGARTVAEVVGLTHALQSCNKADPALMESACCYDAFRAACEKYFAQVDAQ